MSLMSRVHFFGMMDISLFAPCFDPMLHESIISPIGPEDPKR